MPSTEPPRARSLSPPPESIGDPKSNSGFEFSFFFLHLVRQSSLLKSHFVKSRVIGPPSHRLSASELSRRIVHTSTKPFSVSVELSLLLLLLLLLLSAARDTSGCSLRLFDSPCCSTVASVISVSCSKPRFASGGSSGGGAGGGAGGNAEPLLLQLLLLLLLLPPFPGRRKRLLPFALRAMSLALRPLVLRFLGGLSKAIACSLQSFVTFLFPCGNGTVLNDPPLIYDLLLRWHIQGNCLCCQTAQSQFGATTLVAPVEIRAQVEAEELPHVVATQAL